MAPPSPPSAPPQDNNGDEPSCYHQIWRRGSHVDLPGECDLRPRFLGQCLHPHKKSIFQVRNIKKLSMARKHPLSSRLPSSPHVVPAPSPARGASPRPPSRPSWGLMGPEGPGIGRTIPFLAGCVKSHNFAARGQQALPQLPGVLATASARPRGFLHALVISLNH